jgi:hypothetical protein
LEFFPTDEMMADGGNIGNPTFVVKNLDGKVVLKTKSLNKASDYHGLLGRDTHTVETLDGRILSGSGDDMADGGVIGNGKNGYVAFYKGKKVDVNADTMYGAQKTAAKYFNAKKEYDVNVVLAEIDGKQYIQSTAFAKGGYMADGGELTYDDFMVGDFYFNSSEGGKFKFVGKDESGRLRFEDSKGIDRIFSPKRMSKYADGGMMARGGYVSKGELVWKKLTNSERMNFLYKNFTPQITPRSQETLVGKDYNFLPKNVKIVIESKYANVEEYADGGETERKAEAIKTAVEIATMAYKNGVRAYDMDFEDFSEKKNNS